jgi:hypothetical protein
LVLALRTGQDRVKLHFDRLAVRWCGLLLDRLDLEKAFGIHPGVSGKNQKGPFIIRRKVPAPISGTGRTRLLAFGNRPLSDI